MKKNLMVLLIVNAAALPVVADPLAENGDAKAGDRVTAKGSRMIIGEEVLVLGHQQALTEVAIPGSVDVLARDQLAHEHVNFTADLFKKIPGVYLSRFNQGIISANIAMRGFDGEGSSPHSKLLIDGIPSNLHVGYSEMDALFPMEIDNIAVVKGTNDPRYGLHNVAGNVNIVSRRDLNSNELELLAGSFGTYEGEGYYAMKHGDFTQHYFIGTRKTEGYRDHSDLDKTTLSGKWFYNVNDDIELGLIARHFTYEADAPGYLSQEQARRNPTSAAEFSLADGGDKTTDHISLHLDYDLSTDTSWSLKAYGQNFERQRWVRFTAGANQQERYEDEQQRGVISTLSWQPNETWKINWGLDYEAQDNLHQRFVSEDRRRTGVITRNHEFEFNHYGSYLQVQQQVNDAFVWVAGVRANRYSGHFVNRVNGQTRSINDYGTLTQPTLGLQYELSDHLGLFANLGRTHQIGNGIGAYALPGRDVDASRNDGAEIGLRMSPVEKIDLRFSVWQQHASNELAAKADGSGDFENVGETERRGWELLVNWRPNDQWYVWGAYTSQEAILENPGPTNTNIQGAWLNHIPEYTAAVGVDFYITPVLKASLFNTSQSDSYVSNNNDLGRFGEYSVTDLGLSYDWRDGNIGLRITNLTNEFYEYVYYDVDQTIHSPGDGRSATLSVSFDL